MNCDFSDVFKKMNVIENNIENYGYHNDFDEKLIGILQSAIEIALNRGDLLNQLDLYDSFYIGRRIEKI